MKKATNYTVFRRLFKKRHKQRADYHQAKPKEGFFRKLFFKYQVRKDNRYHNAQLIDGHNHAYLATGNGVIVA